MDGMRIRSSNFLGDTVGRIQSASDRRFTLTVDPMCDFLGNGILTKLLEDEHAVDFTVL